MTTVYFIRHGQSTANLSQCFAGHIDVSLTDLGRKQAVCTAEFLADKPIDAVYSSDLSRAYDTARTIADKHGLTVQTSPQLREIYAGEWEGRRFDDLEENEESYRHWIREIGTATCRGGESVVALQQRVADAVAEIVAKHPNESICIVSHGTPIRTMTALWTDTPIELLLTVPWASNASATVVEFTSPHEGKIVAADLHEHLGTLSSTFPPNV
jgi:broad specificity phosphatase PhoE